MDRVLKVRVDDRLYNALQTIADYRKRTIDVDETPEETAEILLMTAICQKMDRIKEEAEYYATPDTN